MPMVLLVDDDEGILHILESLLSEEGYSVLLARNGAEALAQVAAHQPDAILLDVMLPVVSGPQMLLELRRRGVTTPVIFMSAGGRTDEQAATYGADDSLAKPFGLESVLDTVARWTATSPEPTSAPD
jgi:DNA-binding response OmpR family regulator